MRTQLVRAALITACLPTVAAAQSLSLTEADALSRLTDSPRVRAIRTSVDPARADVLAAGRWPNPRGTMNRESAVGITEYIWTVSQTLAITGRRDLAVSASSAHVEAISSRADEQIRRVRADLRMAFAGLVADQSREGELRVAAARVRELATAIGKRETAGDAAGFDRLRAEREALNVEADLGAASAARMNAQAEFAGFFTGMSPAAVIAVPAQIKTRSPLPSVDDLVARAESTRGELRALQHDISSAEFAERAAARRVVPEPEIVAGTKSSSAGGGDIGSVFAVHATIPLFDRARPERTAALARGVQARAEVEAFRTALRAQITGLAAASAERRAAADRYRATEDANADLERIAQVGYDAAEHGILQLLDAYRTTLAARLRQIDLDLAARRADIELEFISGWEIQ